MGKKDRGKKGRRTEKKESEKFQLVGPFDTLEDGKREYHQGQDSEITKVSEAARKKIKEFKESMKDVTDQLDSERAGKVEKMLKDGTAAYDASSGAQLMEKDSDGHHYHMNNPVAYENGFEKHDVFDADGNVNRQSPLFMTCYNSLADFGDVQVTSHNEHDNKYSIYVKNPK